MRADVVTRRIDDGRPLFVWRRRTDPDAVGYCVCPRICTNPACRCTEMELEIHRARRNGSQVDLRGSPTKAFFSLVTSSFMTSDDPSKDPPTWLMEELEEKHEAWFRERWRRTRGQAGDPRYTDEPVLDPGFLSPYHDIVPCDFDLTVVHEGRAFLADDHYCMKPTCSCDEVLVVLRALDEKSEDVGEVRVSMSRLSRPEISGSPVAHALWEKLVEKKSDALQQRFAGARKIASTLSPQEAVRRPSRKVGRNDSCPCGSGKKYKRCCLRAAG